MEKKYFSQMIIHLLQVLLTESVRSLRSSAQRKGNNLVLVFRFMKTFIKLALELKKMYRIQNEVICIDFVKEFANNRYYEYITKHQLSVKTLINNTVFAENGLFNKTDFKRQHEEMPINMRSLTELHYLFLSDMVQQIFRHTHKYRLRCFF